MSRPNPNAKRWYLPDGRYIEVDPRWTDADIEVIRRVYPNLMGDPTVLDRIRDAGEGVLRGLGSSLLGMGQGITALIPDALDAPLESAISSGLGAIASTRDPRLTESWPTLIGEGLGSTLPFLAGGIAAGGLKAVAGLGALSGLGEQEERMAWAEDPEYGTGEDISTGERLAARVFGAAIGTLEAAPIKRGLRVWNELVEQGAKKVIGQEAVRSVVTSALTQGVEEAIQETASNTLQNLTSKNLYDPELAVFTGTRESAVGGFGAGAIMDLIVSAVAGPYGGRFRGGRYAAEAELRRAAMERDMAGIRAKAAELQERASAEGVPVEQLAMQVPEFSVQQGQDPNNPEQFHLVMLGSTPEEGSTLVRSFMTQEEAVEAANKANDDALNVSIAAGALAKLQSQGLDGDPYAVDLAIMAAHPDYMSVPVQVLARYVAEEGAEVGGDRLDPRSPGAREAMALGRSEEQLAELETIEGLRREAVAKLREFRSERKAAPNAPVAVRRPEVGKQQKVGDKQYEVSTEYQTRGPYTIKYNAAEKRWETWFPGAIAPLFYTRTLMEGKAAIREWEFSELKKAADTEFEESQRTLDRREAALRGVVTAREKAAQPLLPRASEDMQEIYDALAGMAATGKWNVTLEEARRILSRDGKDGDERFVALAHDLSTRTLARIAEMNRDLAANKQKNGLPRLRKVSVSNDIAEQARRELLNAAPAAIRYTDVSGGKQTGRITVTDINALLKEKGYEHENVTSTPEFRYLAKQLTGFDIKNVTQAPQWALRLLYARLASMRTRKGAPSKGYRLPDLRPPMYTREQYNRALSLLPPLDAEGPKGVEFNAFLTMLGLEKNAAEQMVDHLVRSGNAKTYVVKRAKKYISRDSRAASGETDFEAGVEAVLETAGEMPESEGKAVSEILRSAFDSQRRLIAAELKADVRDVNDALGSADEVADTAEEATDRLSKWTANVLSWIKATVGADKFSDASLQLVQDINEVTKGVGSALGGKPVAALVIEPGHPAKIAVEIAEFDPDGAMTDEEVMAAIKPRVAHETLRWMREHDYFTQTQWDQIVNFVRGSQIEVGQYKGKTFAEVASELLGNPEGAGAREMVNETGAAMAFAEYVAGTLKGGIGPEGIFKRAAKSLTNLIGLTNASRMAPVLSIFNQMESGAFASVEPGMSAVNPQGPVRSTLLLDREVNPVRNLSAEELAGDQEKYGEQVGRFIAPIAERLASEASPIADAVRMATELGGAVRLADGRDGTRKLVRDLDSALEKLVATEAKSTELVRALPNLDAINDIQRKAKQVLSAVANGEVNRARDMLAEINEVANDAELFAKAVKASTWVPDVRTQYWGGDQPPLTPDQIAALEAKRVEDMSLAERMGVAPRVGANASPEALNVYFNNLNPEGEISTTVRQRFSRANILPLLDSEKYGSPLDYSSVPNQTMIETIRDNISAWQAVETFNGKLEALDNIRAAALKKWTQKFRSGILDRRFEIDEFQQMVDRDAGVKHLADTSVIAAFRNSDRLMHFVGSMLRNGTLRYVQADGVTPSSDPMSGFVKIHKGVGDKWESLIQIMTLLHLSDGTNLEAQAHHYAVAKRIIDLSADAEAARKKLGSKTLTRNEEAKLNDIIRAARIFPGNMTLQQAKNVVNEIEGSSSREAVAIREFTDGWKTVNASLLQLLADTGVIAKEEIAEWKGREYIPFMKRHEKDDFMTVMKRPKKDRLGRKATIERELSGSARKLDVYLFDSLLGRTEEMIHDALTNIANTRFAKSALDIGIGLEVDRSTPWSIKYYDNGKVRYVELDPGYEDLFDATQAANMDLLGGLAAIFPRAANVLRQTVTRMPDFVLRNVFRDSVSAWVTSGANVTPLVSSFRKFFDDQQLGDAELRGIAMEHDFTNDPVRLRKQLRRQIKIYEEIATPGYDAVELFHRAWQASGDWSRRSDTATRMSIFDDVLSRTGNEAEAVHQAFEIIDFGRRGRNGLVRFLSASIPFLNARLQGLDVLWRTARGKYSSNAAADPAEIRKQFMIRGSMLAMATSLYYLTVGDQEWYKDQRDEIKDDYWLMPGPFGTVVRLPAPFEVGVIFKTAPEALLRAIKEEGYGHEELRKSFFRVMRESTSINPLPQAIKPLFEVAVNYDSYTADNIVPQYMRESMVPSDQRNASTTETAALIGQATDTSPIMIDHLVRGYFGQIGMMLMSAFDAVARNKSVRGVIEDIPGVNLQEVQGVGGFPGQAGTRNDWMMLRNVPIVRSLLGERGQGGGYQQRFYEVKTRIDRAIAQINKARSEGRYGDWRRDWEINRALLNYRGTVRALDRYLRRWRERRDDILRSQAYTAEEKREALKELEFERNRNLAVIPGIWDEIREGS